MKPYVKLYLKFFGYTIADLIPCEICQWPSTDIHHIKARGMGGTKKKDTIDNLMALCREHHVEYGDKKQHVDFLREKHKEKMDLIRH